MGHAAELERFFDGEAWFRAFFDASPLATFLKDREGRYLWVNRAWERAFGRDLAWMRGKTDFELFPRQTAELARSHDERVTASGEPIELELEALAANGELRAWRVQKFPVKHAGKQVVAGFVTPLGTSTKADGVARAHKMQALGQLAGGIAHDFNNTLVTILACADIVLEQLPPGSGLAADVRQIRDAGQRAAALTRELGRFVRPPRDEPAGVGVHALFSSLGEILRRLIGESIELRISLDPALGDVEASLGEVEQILLNLVFNARDAMPDGGRLGIRASSVHLDANEASAYGMNEGGYLLLEVSDEGMGMDQETRARIFDPFFTTKDLGRGTGLGLSTVLGIVQRRRGHIAVDTAPGRGATFRVYLPEADAPTSDSRPASQRRPGTETILVVEDDALLCALARRVLEAFGYTVIAADNGKTAVELSRAHPGPIHLVLTDVVMPKLGGESLVPILRAQRPELRALYMSGYPPAVDADMIEKPFTPKSLCEKVREVLDR